VPKADNLPPSCPVVTKSGNLNFLEPSGPLRACNGTALPLLLESRAVYELMWDDMVQLDRPQMTMWRMRIACCMPKARKHTQNM